jgi:hypothetical protein
MILFVSRYNADVVEVARLYSVGVLHTPRHFSADVGGLDEAADNGCFGTFDERRFRRYLKRLAGRPVRFITAPDVVGNHAATLAFWPLWLPVIRSHGLPAAFVVQDGATVEAIPWDECDAVFVGGTTAFKMGSVARSIIAEAKRRDKWVHMGRVNSRRRIQYASDVGCDSVDGSGFVRFLKHLPWGARAVHHAHWQQPFEF